MNSRWMVETILQSTPLLIMLSTQLCLNGLGLNFLLNSITAVGGLWIAQLVLSSSAQKTQLQGWHNLSEEEAAILLSRVHASSDAKEALGEMLNCSVTTTSNDMHDLTSAFSKV